MIFGLFRRRDDQQQVRAIYAAIVAQARQPAFYSITGVPDTLEGRYEMLMLHAFLYLHRLKTEAQEAKDVAQKVFDLMFADMDRSLREIGIGDLTVPKKIKKMAQAFYGRTAAYDSALSAGGGALEEAVRRNVFSGEAGDAAGVADYMRAAVAALAAQPASELTSTGPIFSPASALEVPATVAAQARVAAPPPDTVAKPRSKARKRPPAKAKAKAAPLTRPAKPAAAKTRKKAAPRAKAAAKPKAKTPARTGAKPKRTAR